MNYGRRNGRSDWVRSLPLDRFSASALFAFARAVSGSARAFPLQWDAYMDLRKRPFKTTLRSIHHSIGHTIRLLLKSVVRFTNAQAIGGGWRTCLAFRNRRGFGCSG